MYGSLKITRRRGGQVLSFVTGLIASVGASANPQGAQVVSGSAVFANPNPQTLEITNSPAAVLNWQSFDIAHGETTRFIQQNAASAVLNRVTTGNSSEILGSLVSNGHVFLINPAGILIGRDGSVDTAGVVLSTLQISDQDFINGRLHFEGANSSGAITNHGYIKSAPGGEVVLIAPRIENAPQAGNANSGLIESPNGDLILAAGSSITIASLDDPDISFDVRAPDNEVVNLGRLLAQGGTASVLAGTIRHSGEINADSFSRNDAGHIVLKATSHISLDENSSIHASGGKTAAGGKIELTTGNHDTTGQIDALGVIRADGVNGGRVTVRSADLLLDGMVSARGQIDGGNIDVKTWDSTIATVNAKVQAIGAEGQGGTVHVDGGNSTFSSASMRASGEKGGSVRVLGDEVTLAAAKIRADGMSGGGKVRIGGGFRGGENLHASNKVQINDTSIINASARDSGKGGDVVVWSDGTTRFAGAVGARGGADSGDGGQVEISGRAGVGFNGKVDVTAPNGEPGSLLMDPKNVRFTSDELPAQPIRLLDPHPGAGNQFGSRIEFFNAAGTSLNGNSAGASTAVVFDIADDFGGVDAGAVYVYRMSDGALLSGLHGLTGRGASDFVGDGGLLSVGSAHILRSDSFGSNAGALTLFDPVNGTSGTISASNSLIGAAANDHLGSAGLIPLGNGVIGVLNPFANSSAGAITFATATSMKGVVSTGNSLLGAASGDQVGNFGDLQFAGSGRWVMRSNNSGFGAITVIDTAALVTGTVDQTNSLVGANSGDLFGSNPIGQISGRVVYQNNQGGFGAVTVVDTAAPVTGIVGSSNSLVGANSGDLFGSDRVGLGGGRILIHGTNGGFGSITVLDIAAPVTGTVDSSNSLVGGLNTDAIGDDYNNRLGSSDIFAVHSSNWNGGIGAVTFVDTTTSVTGVVTASNSLVGSSVGDLSASNTFLTNISGNNYLLFSDNGGAGAVTFVSDTVRPNGPIDQTNSLVGASSSDAIAHNANFAPGNFEVIGSNYVIYSPHWNSDRGAVTVGSVNTGLTGVVGNSNSLTGVATGDLVGDARVVHAPNDFGGHVLLRSNNGGKGAVTFMDLNSPVTGQVSASNSVVGSASGDAIGGDGVESIDGNNIFAVYSSHWATPLGLTDAGAVTMIDINTGNFAGTATLANGVVDATNSLLGSNQGDLVGSGKAQFMYSGPSQVHYAVLSPHWHNSPSVPDAGAVTWFTLGSQVTGPVSATNSLVGTSTGDLIGNTVTTKPSQGIFISDAGVGDFFNGNAIYYSPTFNSNGGAVVFLNGDTPTVGGVSVSTALIGGTSADHVGAGGIIQSGNHYLVLSPDWDNVSAPNAGAVTVADTSTGITGFVDATTSLVGDQANDHVGQFAPEDLGFTGNLLLSTQGWHSGTGAVTFLDMANGHLIGDTDFAGVLDSSNSLVGGSVGDGVGVPNVDIFFNGNYLVRTQGFSSGTGAMTFGSGSSGVAGVISASNSLVGGTVGDLIGDGSLSFLSSGNVIIHSTQWNGGRGALTFLDINSGKFGGSSGTLAGVLDETNSLVGHSAGDDVGNSSVSQFFAGGHQYYGVFNPLVDNSFAGSVDSGAVAFGDAFAGLHGFIDDNTVAFVGTHNGDNIGASSTAFFLNASGNRLLVNSQWNSNAGAVTFVDLVNGTGLAGDIDATTSVIGQVSGDRVGSGGVAQLSGSSVFAILSPNWSNNGSTANAGAITWGNASTGAIGLASANGLVGANAGDNLGANSINQLTFTGASSVGYINTPSFNGNKSALTFFRADQALPTGSLGAANSLVGSTAGDNLGSRFVFTVGSGAGTKVLVGSPFWDNGSATDAGAITTFLAATPRHGVVGASNSLVGTHGGDSIGGGNFGFFSSDAVVFLTPNWNAQSGAITYWRISSNLTGNVGAANSLIGSSAGDAVGSSGLQVLRDPNFQQPKPELRFILTPDWDNGSVVDAGAFTMLDTTKGTFAGTNIPFRGEINSSNSLVGTFASDRIGDSRIGGQALVVNTADTLAALLSPNWKGTRGAITWFTPGESLVGEISRANSLVGSTVGDAVGGPSGSIAFFNQGTATEFGGVFTPTWNGGRGAITWLQPGQGVFGAIGSGNSLIGASAGDAVGSPSSISFQENFNRFGLFPLLSGNFVLKTDNFNQLGGAITFIDIAHLPKGTVNAGNSFVGAPGDQLGDGGLFMLDGDRVLISSPLATVDGLTGAGRLDLLDGSKRQVVDSIGLGAISADELAVSIPAVVNFLNSGGALTVQASNDIFIPEGTNFSAKGGSLTLAAGRSIEVRGNIFTTGFLRLFANAPGGDASLREPGQGFVSVLAGANPSTVIANQLEVDAEDVVVQGGTAKGAFALLYGLDTATILAHGSGTVTLRAGSGEDIAPTSSLELLSSLLPGQIANGNPITIDAPIALLLGGKSLDVNSAQLIEMYGGGSAGSFASIASFGELKVQSPDITMEVGTASNTDAVFLGMGGAADITFTTCTGCGDLLADPLLDATSQTGTFLAGLFSDPTISGVLSGLPRTSDRDPETDEEKEKKKKDAEAKCN